MKKVERAAAAAVLALAAIATCAQPASGAGPGPHGPGAAGSAPMGGPRWGSDNTSGWSMMSPQERQEHQARMSAMKAYDECKSYRDEHNRQMVERAKQQGRSAPAQPRRDACAGLKQ